MKQIKELNCILLIDDDEFTNSINVKVIEKARIHTHIQVTTSAEEALEYLRETGRFTHITDSQQPGIILLDLNMPGMNGWEFLEEYTTLLEERKAGIVIVVLTSSNHPGEQEKLSGNKDVVAFWTKPLKPDALTNLVQAHFVQRNNGEFN